MAPASQPTPGKLKFLVICPAAKEFRATTRASKPSALARVFRYSMLTPLYVAAAAPDFAEPAILDEHVEPVDYDTDADIVGISFMTYNAPRAYEIAARFRSQGKRVIFGGHHPTLAPEDAIRHCDAVCIGEAEPNLPRMMEDFRDGRLQKFYCATTTAFGGRPVQRSLIQARHYITTNVVQATRGCWNQCAFCSIAAFNKRSFRARAVEEVVEEIKALPGDHVLFMDDNITVDTEYAGKLFRRLAPLKRRWYGQAGVDSAADPEFLRLMAASGCRGLFVGFESLSQECLDESGKAANRAAYYQEAVQRFHAHGIMIMGAFVFGFDHDSETAFATTARFIKDAQIDALQLTILTPFPGTPLFARLDAENRISDRNWEHYDLGHVVFEPRGMTGQQLQAGHDRAVREFYSWPAIVRRLSRQLRYLAPREVLLSLLLGIGYRLKMKRTGLRQGPPE